MKAWINKFAGGFLSFPASEKKSEALPRRFRKVFPKKRLGVPGPKKAGLPILGGYCKTGGNCRTNGNFRRPAPFL